MAEALFVAKHLLAHLLLPPIGFLWLALIGVLVRRRRPWGTTLTAGGLLLALLASTPVVSGALLSMVESRGGAAVGAQALDTSGARPPSRQAVDAGTPQAIVVLGGGLRFDARERPAPLGLGTASAERVVHGVRLARRSHLPVAVTGGPVIYATASEAALMAQVMTEDFGITPRWLEERALDTRDNATRTAALLGPGGVRRIVLVTHAYHMARARYAFERAGFDVTPAPFGFLGGDGDIDWMRWLPSARGAALAYLAAHEAIGELWYRLADTFGPDVDKAAPR